MKMPKSPGRDRYGYEPLTRRPEDRSKSDEDDFPDMAKESRRPFAHDSIAHDSNGIEHYTERRLDYDKRSADDDSDENEAYKWNCYKER